jgi:hypothetical protein
LIPGGASHASRRLAGFGFAVERSARREIRIVPQLHAGRGKRSSMSIALDLCAHGIGKSLNVQGVIANDSLLALEISRPVADLTDRLMAEQLVRAKGRKKPVRRSSSR